MPGRVEYSVDDVFKPNGSQGSVIETKRDRLLQAVFEGKAELFFRMCNRGVVENSNQAFSIEKMCYSLDSNNLRWILSTIEQEKDE
ncbi:unnamed protein product [Haemonchus placei]|uniref:Transposase n=1 Tax=Haemonchus placei TaxID=6290 RepID=A0A0N4WWV4_HAEPC|nr:unnamed protein product [Haemonchus placei]